MRQWLRPLLLLVLWGCGSQAPGCRTFFPSSWVGQNAQDVELVQFPAGNLVQLSDFYRASPALLIFWASWCPACTQEIPELNGVHQKYKENLKILGINVEEDQDTVKHFTEEHAMDYSILLDEKGEAAQKYEVAGLPTMILLAKGGEILYYGFTLPRDLDARLDSTKEISG